MNLLLLLCPALVLSLLYNPNQYTIGNNTISNFNFISPLLPSNAASSFYSNLDNWNCSNNCQLVHMLRRCMVWTLTCNTTFEQAIELDASFNLDSYTQNIVLTQTGLYQLQVQWMPAFYLPLGKNMLIKINGTLIGTIVPTDGDLNDHLFQILVNLTAGSAVFQLVQQTASDSYGGHIGRVYLQYLKPIPAPTELVPLSGMIGQPLSFFTQILLENITENINLFPGSRVFTYTLTNFLISFDRLQFYYYHKQNFTYSSEILLYNAMQMGLERGSITQQLMENQNNTFCNSVTSAYDTLVNALDHKKQYTQNYLLERNQNGMGFFANNLDFFFYQLPIIFASYTLLLLAFRALFNYRISKYIRKYAFYGVLLLIIYEGNVEQFTFFFFNQCRNLFSLNFSHKLANVFMLYFFFLMLVFSIGGLLFFTFNYRKLVKYFLEDSETANIEAAIIESLERSTFPMIFGAVHALFLEWLWLQTIVLFSVELIYLLFKIWTLRSLTPKYKFKVVMCSITSFLRLAFILTFYMYEHYNHPEIMNMVHYDMVLLYLVSWIVQFLHDSVVFVVEIKQAVTGFCKGEKKLEKQAKEKTIGKSMKHRRMNSDIKMINSHLVHLVDNQTGQIKSSKNVETVIFYDQKHKRSQSSINERSAKKSNTTKNPKRRSKSSFNDERSGNQKVTKKQKSNKQLKSLKNLKEPSHKTIVLKSSKDISRVPTMIIRQMNSEGVFPAVGKK